MLPCLTIVLVAFWAQGLYPGVLLHPAEEMRRVHRLSASFFWEWLLPLFCGETLKRLFPVGASLGMGSSPPLCFFSALSLRRSLAPKPWWGVPCGRSGRSGPTAQKVVRSFRDGMLGVRVTGVLASETDARAGLTIFQHTVGEMWRRTLEFRPVPRNMPSSPCPNGLPPKSSRHSRLLQRLQPCHSRARYAGPVQPWFIGARNWRRRRCRIAAAHVLTDPPRP